MIVLFYNQYDMCLIFKIFFISSCYSENEFTYTSPQHSHNYILLRRQVVAVKRQIREKSPDDKEYARYASRLKNDLDLKVTVPGLV